MSSCAWRSASASSPGAIPGITWSQDPEIRLRKTQDTPPPSHPARNKWHLVQTLEVTESGTYDVSCDNRNTEFGLASTYVADSAGMRQFTWAVIWITLPVLGLATTVTIAVVTRRRDRQEKAAASGRH
ncbi:hypothetical protein GCM10009551_015510 [Nocardiopsis tropica]